MEHGVRVLDVRWRPFCSKQGALPMLPMRAALFCLLATAAAQEDAPESGGDAGRDAPMADFSAAQVQEWVDTM